MSLTQLVRLALAGGLTVGAGALIGVLLALAAMPPGATSMPSVFAVGAHEPPESAFNILFAPAAGDFGDPRLPEAHRRFETMVKRVVADVSENNVIHANQKLFNFWYTTQSVRIDDGRGHCPQVHTQDLGRLPLYADAVVILNNSTSLDCNEGNVATAHFDQTITILHELGHGVFHLPDEYLDPNAHYQQSNGILFIGDKGGLSMRKCKNGLHPNWWNCKRIGANCEPRRAHVIGFSPDIARSEGCLDVVMYNAGLGLRHHGPADWVAIEDVITQALPNAQKNPPNFGNIPTIVP